MEKTTKTLRIPVSFARPHHKLSASSPRPLQQPGVLLAAAAAAPAAAAAAAAGSLRHCYSYRKHSYHSDR